MKNLKLFLVALLVAFSQCKNNDSEDGGCQTCVHTISGSETAGVVAASTQGKHTLTMKYAKTNSPFPDGTIGEFEITSDNKLIVSIKGDCVTLVNPFGSCDGCTEAIYVDNCKFNLFFAVSESSNGGLNEINIADLNSREFLGQFHE